MFLSFRVMLFGFFLLPTFFLFLQPNGRGCHHAFWLSSFRLAEDMHFLNSSEAAEPFAVHCLSLRFFSAILLRFLLPMAG